MQCVLTAKPAVLAHFKPVRVVLLILHGIIVSLLAFCASHGYSNSHCGTPLCLQHVYFLHKKKARKAIMSLTHPKADVKRSTENTSWSLTPEFSQEKSIPFPVLIQVSRSYTRLFLRCTKSCVMLQTYMKIKTGGKVFLPCPAAAILLFLSWCA